MQLRFVTLLSFFALGVSLAENPRVLAAGRIPATAVDSYGETIGGIGSAIAVVPGGLVMLSDRGAGDGTIDFRPRFQTFRLARNGWALGLTLDHTTLLRDSNGKCFTGLLPDQAAAFPPQRGDGRMCLDPEGLAMIPGGGFFISDEYQPGITQFGTDGSFVKRFKTPRECLPKGAGGLDFTAADEGALVSGREPNRGFEGLTLLPGGKSVAAILQSGLRQDGGRESGFSRIYIFDVKTGKATACYMARFEEPSVIEANAPAGKEAKAKHLAFCSLEALDDGRFLAIERENFGADGSEKPEAARWKSVVLLDCRGATNILGKKDFAGAQPAKRSVLANLAAMDTSAAGLSREELPAKWEGLSISGRGDGKLRLLLSSDNDFLAPELKFRGAGDRLETIGFPRVKVSQDTWVVEIEVDLPSSIELTKNEKSQDHEKQNQ